MLPYKNKSFSEVPQASFHSYHKYQLVHLYAPSTSPVIYRAVGIGNHFSFLVILSGSVFSDSTVSRLNEIDFFFIQPAWLKNIFVVLVSCFRNIFYLLCTLCTYLCPSGSSKIHLIKAFSFFEHLWRSLIFLH